MCRMAPTFFSNGGFINTGIFQFLVIACCGLVLLPAIVLTFLSDWNLIDAYEDARSTTVGGGSSVLVFGVW